jgi:hypothetical protein
MHASSSTIALPTFDAVAEAERIIAKSLAEAYAGKIPPEGILELLKSTYKLGIVCAMFFNGRSGSYFAQSFFDHERHPQVLTAHAVALINFDELASIEALYPFNCGAIAPGPDLRAWCEQFHSLSNMPYVYSSYPGQEGFDALRAPKELYLNFVYAQLLLTEPGNLTTENFLKMLFLAYRLARGGPVACKKQLVYLWQAHTPSAERSKKIRQLFRQCYQLTVVRFFEKSLDSHLVHHLFETPSPPFHTLFRRLCYDLMTLNLTLAEAPDWREVAIRFEDLHHHTSLVLRSLCEWFGVEFDAELGNTSFTWNVRGTGVSGTRQLTRAEFEPKLLSHYDCLKLRYLLHENYRLYGYDQFCEPKFEASLEEYRREAVVQHTTFSAHALGALMSGEPADAVALETQLLEEMYRTERARRNQGAHLLPLLYELPKDSFKPA